MPTYDYVCSACGHRFEEFQSMTSKVLKKCPECKKPALDRLIGAGAAVIFKGSGFYQTDYKNSGRPKDGGKDAQKDSPKDAPKDGTAKPCTPTCGTDAAPTGCAMNKSPEKGTEKSGDKSGDKGSDKGGAKKKGGS